MAIPTSPSTKELLFRLGFMHDPGTMDYIHQDGRRVSRADYLRAVASIIDFPQLMQRVEEDYKAKAKKVPEPIPFAYSKGSPFDPESATPLFNSGPVNKASVSVQFNEHGLAFVRRLSDEEASGLLSKADVAEIDERIKRLLELGAGCTFHNDGPSKQTVVTMLVPYSKLAQLQGAA